MKHIRFVLLIVLVSVTLGSWNTAERKEVKPDLWVHEAQADSVLAMLSLREQIGQLLMVAAYSNKDSAHVQELRQLVADGVGGFCFFQGSPARQIAMIHDLQQRSALPLWMSMDAEWGLSMRLDSTMRFPRQLMLGALEDDSLIYQMGRSIGGQLRDVGVHVSFAPVLDVNNNPENPVINSRSFGEDPLRVAQLGSLYFQGLQDAGVLAVGKHFPGHGDTDADSHQELPVIPYDKKRLRSLEWVPFARCIEEGLGGIMTAHLRVPELDSRSGMLASLSKRIIQGALKNELGFAGVTFTDALTMKGVTQNTASGEREVRALLAGNDVLLFPEDPVIALQAIETAVSEGRIAEKLIRERCKKVLMAKAWLGLFNTDIEAENEISQADQIGHPQDAWVNLQLNRGAQTLLRNVDSIVPYRDLAHKNIVSIAIGDAKEPYPFQENLLLFDRIPVLVSPKKPTSFERKLMMDESEGATHFIVSLHDTKLRPTGNFGITRESLLFVEQLQQQAPVTLVVFGNPYALREWPAIDSINTVLIGYEESAYAQQAAAEALFGSYGVSGSLPVSISDAYPQGYGMPTKSLGRLQYSMPEATGLRTRDLAKIDSIARYGIDQQAFPGCQILVAHKGQVVYHKSLGYHTYQNEQAVQWKDLYDLASVTKIAATVASFMRLADEGVVHVDSTLGTYLPEWTAGTPYNDLVIKDMLTHHARLRAWIPFYQRTLSSGVPRYDVYSMGQSELYPFRVAENLYIQKAYPDSVFRQILRTPLRKKREYVYSDLGYYFLKRIIEKQEGKSLEQVADSLYYRPLGCYTTMFRPRERFGLEQVVPTEYDVLFRKQLVHGDVHDPGAAMLGGVGGHAGLFSNANDLAKVMQMWLNGGTYGRERYLSDSLVHAFTKCLYCANPNIDNWRGLGFDKPVRDGDGGPTCTCISYASFGHTGFTGTIAWADPEEEVVFIFLSNRVYPDAQNRKLITLGTRTEIMQVIYDAIHNAKTVNRPL